jgi:hypothetical protein
MNVRQALVIKHAQDDREAINLKADLPTVRGIASLACRHQRHRLGRFGRGASDGAHVSVTGADES